MIKPNTESDWITELLNELIDTGTIYLTKDDMADDRSVDKYAYARERLREEQRQVLLKARTLILQKLVEAREEELLLLRIGNTLVDSETGEPVTTLEDRLAELSTLKKELNQ